MVHNGTMTTVPKEESGEMQEIGHLKEHVVSDHRDDAAGVVAGLLD